MKRTCGVLRLVGVVAEGLSEDGPSPTTKFVKRAEYCGWFEVDASQPDAKGETVKQPNEEVLRHIAAAEGAEKVEIVIDVCVENSLNFSESVARTVKEKCRVFNFDVSEFEDFEW